jgi:SET domain-containing protein
MIIPWVRIVWISDQKGYGLVASRPIPKGTVTFAQDGLDIVIPNDGIDRVDPQLMEYVEKYSYEDYLGNRIVSWDLAKYMNHDDDANTLTTGYGFEVAVRDIEEGEEVTDDYRIFSTLHDTNLIHENRRIEEIKPWPDHLLAHWDSRVKESLLRLPRTEQPLLSFIQPDTWNELRKLPRKLSSYRSVSESLPLRYKIQTAIVLESCA